ncbi:MAG: tetratricopeptide repeat protein [Phycisphaerae bacterium]|nr:tetratricopeptide repeat protein [Phycisphaerae bacterium]
MTRRWLPVLPAVTLLLAAGCQGTMPKAREEGTRRWNTARAQVKARLAAEQIATGNVAGAAAELAEADRLDPNDESRIPLRARVWLAQGQTDRALAALRKAHLDGPAQAEVDYLLGVALQQQQRWDDALAAYRRAAECDQQHVAYPVAVAQTLLQLGKPAEARAALTARAQQFEWTDAYQATLAECCEQSNDWVGAATAWQRIAASPQAGAEQRERLATALFRAGRTAEATPLLVDIVGSADGTPASGLRLMLAECYLEQGNSAAARTQAQLVLQANSEHLLAQRTLARALAQSGDLAGALRVAQQALQQDRKDARSLELVSALAARTGDAKLATSAAQALLARDAENPVALAVLQQPTP